MSLRKTVFKSNRKKQDRENCGTFVFPLDELLTILEKQFSDREGDFETVILPVFHELVRARMDYEDSLSELDGFVSFRWRSGLNMNSFRDVKFGRFAITRSLH